MKAKHQIIKIISIKYINEYSLLIEFSDGKINIIDFEPFLENSKNPEIRKFLDQSKFKKFKLENGDLMWGDFDLLFPIMDLYENCILPADTDLQKPRVFSDGRKSKVI